MYLAGILASDMIPVCLHGANLGDFGENLSFTQIRKKEQWLPSNIGNFNGNPSSFDDCNVNLVN